MSSSPEEFRPTRRERRPTEKVTAEGTVLHHPFCNFTPDTLYILAETVQQKQAHRKIAQAKTDANKHKKARKQQQIVERDLFNNQENQGTSVCHVALNKINR